MSDFTDRLHKAADDLMFSSELDIKYLMGNLDDAGYYITKLEKENMRLRDFRFQEPAVQGGVILDKDRYQVALINIAAQHLSTETEDLGDVVDGYDCIIEVARKVLKGTLP